ncbi:MAG: hypothetical protein JWO05_3493 [Gemmatimonadetes bacterium]|nr:hypothetical protein [Gemmatimonadota bacterium]
MTRSRLALLAVVTLALPAGAQEWRTLDVSRQLRDSATHRVRVEYGAGTFELKASADPVLYSMQIRYDERQGGTPVHRYDGDAHDVTLGISSQTFHVGRHIDIGKEGEMRLALARGVPLDLELNLGAAQARADLGGLSLHSLRVETGASDTRLEFTSLNPVAMTELDANAGAAALELVDIANANTGHVRVRGGVGGLTLGFGGAWTRDMDLDVSVALGKVTVKVPSDVGVRIELSRMLATFDHEGMEKRSDAWYSTNWDRAKYHLKIKGETTFGAFALERL